MTAPRVLIAGGGTAGHVLPGIAIAEELVRTHGAEIIWVGSQRGLETTLVPAKGFELIALEGRGIARSFSRQNLASAMGIARAVKAAFKVMRTRRPAVVVSLGGYAAFPAGLAALVTRTPIVVAEQNARSGAVNRFLGRFARSCAVPFAGTDLPHSVVTGNPVREEIIEATAVSKEAAGAQLGVPGNRTLVMAFAGSLGAKKINLAIAELAHRWAARSDLAIYHIVGARDFADPSVMSTIEPNDGSDGLWYQVVEYDDEIANSLRAADLVVCRAGGTSIAELAALGIASILVPLPIATRDHQFYNAAELVQAGAAVLCLDADFSADWLEQTCEGLLRDGQLDAMGHAAQTTSHPQAAKAIGDLVMAAL